VLSHGIGHIFAGRANGSRRLVLLRAKKDPNPRKLESRQLFFSSLVFISFGKAFESCFHCRYGEALNFGSNTGSKLLVYQRRIALRWWFEAIRKQLWQRRGYSSLEAYSLRKRFHGLSRQAARWRSGIYSGERIFIWSCRAPIPDNYPIAGAFPLP